MRRIFLFIAVIFAICCHGLMAQDLQPKGTFNLNLDYARFVYDDQSGYLEIYYAFYPFQLGYLLSDGKYKGGIKLTTRLINNKTKEAVIDDRVVLPVVISDTTDASYRFPFISQSGFAVPFGEYTLKVVAADSLDEKREDSIRLPITLSPYAEEFTVSDIELCSNIKSSQQKDDPFYKNSLEVVPNATLIFGVTAYPVVFHYLELYHLTPGETYTIRKYIEDSQGKIIRESTKSKKFNVKNAPLVGMTNVTSILSGKYHFGIDISNSNSEIISQVKKTFFIYNPHLQPDLPTNVVIQPSEFAGMSGEELSEEFRRAKYIATDEEIKIFKQIDTDAGKRDFLAKFWTNVLKGRMGRPPMKRIEYLKRIEVANERYRSLGKEGWLTDRGRVYILYGEPDEIDRNPSVSETKPYEIWRYHEIENGVEFIFIDQLGYGNYRLIHSTKRGELREDNWQSFLR